MNRIIIITILTAFVFFGCGQKKSDNNTSSGDNKTSTTENKTEPGALAFAPKEFYKSVNDCKQSDTCTYFKITYIEATGGKIKDKLNTFINKEILLGSTYGDSTPVSIQAAADSFITSYKQTKKDFPDMPGSWAWEYNMKIYYETPKILCLVSDAYMFTGGAHPNSFSGYYNINKETGDTLSLKDLLAPGFETKLNQLIDKKYREMKGLKPGDNLAEKGDLFDNKIGFNYNVAVTKEGGLEFYYNPYEIAPYAVGPIQITLTKAELGELIGANSPLK